MRFVTKFYVVAFLTTCALTYFTYQLFNRQQPYIAPFSAGGGQHPARPSGDQPAADSPQPPKSDRNDFQNRLVVFGDSSVDDSIFRVPSKGKVWTELLCSQYDCTREKYSQASDSSIAFVDSHELELFDLKHVLSAAPLPDFAAQVDLFLDKEHEAIRGLTDRAIVERRQNSVFVVQFGLWDIWRLLGRAEKEIQESISRNIDQIFKQLSRLVEEFNTTDVKVVMLGGVDVTFLPAYTAADGDRQAIEVSEQWNKELRKRTEEFKKCSIFLVDMNTFLVEQFRLRELWANGYIENEEYAKGGRIPWMSVREPCLDTTAKRLLFLSGATCKEPERYLFWDAMHLGPGAHKLLAADIYRDIRPLWLEQKRDDAQINSA